MSGNATKRAGWKIALIGVSLVLLALAAVLGTVFLPRVRQLKRMKEILSAFLPDNASYITVTDPLYDTGNLLGNDGREILLDEEQTDLLCQELQTIAAGDLKWAGEESLPAGSFERRIFLRAADGGMVQFYVTQNTICYLDGTKYYRFVQSKGGGNIDALYALLTQWMEDGERDQ